MNDIASQLEPQIWQIVIFVVDGIDNHCGLDIPAMGLADCSLAGARIIGWDHRSVPKGERHSFDVVISDPDRAVAFAKRPGTLAYPIIAQEKRHRGWHLTPDAPAFVRTLRDVRSTNPDDMNCVEWLWRVLELGGVTVPNDVLTPHELAVWCRAKLNSSLPVGVDQ